MIRVTAQYATGHIKTLNVDAEDAAILLEGCKPLSMLDATVPSYPETVMPIVQSEPRHMACTLLDVLLDNIIAHQDTGNSNVAEAMRLEYGESVTASIMQAAGIRRLRQQMEKRNGTPKATGASGQ